MAVDPNMIDLAGADAAATPDAHALDRLANKFNAADGADLANKKTKLAEQAHRSTHSEESGLTQNESKKGPLSQAFDASSGKLVSGAVMFASFSTLLMGMMLAVPVVLPFLPSALSTVVSAAATGAVWLGGNEFYKVYKEENSRLNKTVEGIKSRFGKQHEQVAAVAPEQAQAQQPAPAMQSETVEHEAPRTSSTIQAILDAGPRSHANAVLERGSRASLSPEELAAQAQQTGEPSRA